MDFEVRQSLSHPPSYGYEHGNVEEGALTGSFVDLRGVEVLDRDHHRIGMISEVYCSEDDLRALYVEIVPYDKNAERSFLYPFENLTWGKEGPVFLGSTWDTLAKFREYDVDYKLNKLNESGEHLITYNEALDQGFSDGWSELDWRDCA